MKRGSTQAQNHPKKGTSTFVEPIKCRDAIAQIKENLRNRPRDLCLFTLGINTAYRANELMSLSVGQVAHLKPGDVLYLKQRKNSENRTTTINRAAYVAIQNWLGKHPHCVPEAPLFISQRTSDPICVPECGRKVKKWCRKIGLVGNYGSHSLRKTWGYHQFRENKGQGYILVILQSAYGHRTQQQTLDYLCIQTNEIRSLYLDLEL